MCNRSEAASTHTLSAFGDDEEVVGKKDGRTEQKKRGEEVEVDL